MSSTVTISISLPGEVARQLPEEPAERERVLELGLRHWRAQQALEAYRRGEGTLAHAAAKAGLSLREIIPLAYAFGLTPKVPADWLSAPLTLERASRL
jgi:hypothetical protein